MPFYVYIEGYDQSKHGGRDSVHELVIKKRKKIKNIKIRLS